jgi:signal transduction histidine kinase
MDHSAPLSLTVGTRIPAAEEVATVHIEQALPVARHAEQTWYRAYERQRRLRLARILLPICAIIELLLFALSTLLMLSTNYAPPRLQIAIAVDVIEALCAVAYVAGLLFVRRQRVGPAVACVLVPASVTILLPVLAYDLADLLAPSALLNAAVTSLTVTSILASLVLIVLVSVLTASRWLTVGTTLLMNLFTVVIALYASGLPTTSPVTQAPSHPFLALAILAQWTIGGILVVAAQIQRATTQELETTRVAYERSRQLEALKDQFITHINHEVRSPVMALQGYVDLLQATAESATPVQRATYVGRAKRAADNLVTLVRSILSVRALEQETAPIDFQAVDLHASVRAAVDAIDPAEAGTAERELGLRIPPTLAVWGDPVRVQQILTNLLSNAVKYSAPGTPVEVAARSLPGSGRRARHGHTDGAATPALPIGPRRFVEITVRDRGLGIPPEQIPLLFERFVRLPRDLASNVSGNGLGLYLCRTLAEAMGGSIWVESDGIAGEGSTFHVELPGAEGIGVEVRGTTN